MVRHLTSALVHTKRRKGKDETSAGILYSVSNPLQGFRFKYGLRNKDIPVTIWAVVPYSFMIDRVFHISAALRAVTNLADPDVHILAAWSRSKIEDEETLSFDSNWTYPNSVPGVATVYVEGSKHKNKTFSYTRDVWKPTVADAIPPATYAKFVDSFTKLADITAITHTLLSKRQ